MRSAKATEKNMFPYPILAIWFFLLTACVPDSVAEMNQRAVELLEKGEFDQAITLLQKAVEQSDGDEVLVKNLAVALNNRGLDRLERARYGAAIQDFSKAVELVEDNPLFQTHLGYAYLLSRDYVHAESNLRQVMRKHPDEPKVYEFLGFLYYTRDDLAEAIKCYEARLSLGADQWTEKQLERARREYSVSGDFVDRSSSDFTLKFLGDAESRAIASDILTMLAEARGMVGFDLDYFPKQKTTVILYSDADFRRVTGAHDWVGGLYDGKIRLPIHNYQKRRDAVLRTARHEYTHRVVADLAPNCPAWFNEGLAEWSENGGEGAHDQIRKLQKSGVSVPSFRDLPTSFASEADPDQVAIQYAMSRSMVAFVRDRAGLGAIRGILRSMADGVELNEAIQRNVGKDVDELEGLWRQEILR